MKIREITISDAKKFVQLTKEIEGHSEFMLWEPDERTVTSEQQRKRIEALEDVNNSTIFVAEEENKLVGFLVAMGGNARRNQHTVYLVIGILKDYRGQRIGSRLFSELEKWGKERNIHRLELTVVTKNIGGLALYKKMGFIIEGTKKHSLLIDGEFVDEYYMSKLI
ncbi:GNAT family N-acetyltransferase [Pontibacillus yanchengensis]|uniref:GCN5 family acetyltransferase n=1 Tax=Pontibacillus yanchengensis Y32 TaxID=1385514 RepID=A0A0A2TAB7_9BACI|nr:GNAT family N-acetyltransferase [Pontibacillus yanchengensis]KGP71026.1 GCN5 family acetyltransferase [Pontibacillus yanchengensis Y32]